MSRATRIIRLLATSKLREDGFSSIEERIKGEESMFQYITVLLSFAFAIALTHVLSFASNSSLPETASAFLTCPRSG